MMEKIKKYIETYNMIEKGDKIILGISGGADSVCLFFMLLDLKEVYDLELLAVHVNHNLRGEDAVRDQVYVMDICKKYGVECVVEDIDVALEAKKRKKSLEETGREVRQEVFARVAKGEKQVKIATAHHCNDNVETMLMNLARGTGISGLTGIAPMVQNKIRPLLCVTREEIEKYLEENNILYCIDETNHENIYIRNVIRNQIIPIFEQGVNTQAVSHMSATIEEMTKIEAHLQEELEELWRHAVEEVGQESGREELVICKEILQNHAQILQERLVKRSLEWVAGYQRDITRVHVMNILELFEKQVGKEVHLPYEMVAKRSYEGIRIYTLQEREEVEKVLSIPGKCEITAEKSIEIRVLEQAEYLEKYKENKDAPYTKYFDYDIIGKILRVRTRRSGDYIVIHKNGNKQMLKKYYINNKIPEKDRDDIMLIAAGDEILWIVGYRKSSGYEVTEHTKKILEIQYDGGNHGRNS